MEQKSSILICYCRIHVLREYFYTFVCVLWIQFALDTNEQNDHDDECSISATISLFFLMLILPTHTKNVVCIVGSLFFFILLLCVA